MATSGELVEMAAWMKRRVAGPVGREGGDEEGSGGGGWGGTAVAWAVVAVLVLVAVVVVVVVVVVEVEEEEERKVALLVAERFAMILVDRVRGGVEGRITEAGDGERCSGQVWSVTGAGSGVVGL